MCNQTSSWREFERQSREAAKRTRVIDSGGNETVNTEDVSSRYAAWNREEEMSENPHIEPKTDDVQESGQCDCEDCEIEAEEISLPGGPYQVAAPGEHGHYSRFSPQPIDVIAAWNLDHWQAEALTYLVRHDMKGGREDLEKCIWYVNDLMKRKYGE